MLVLHLFILYLCRVNEDKNMRSHERKFTRPREREKNRVNGHRWTSKIDKEDGRWIKRK